MSKSAQIVADLRSRESVLVAFSGGVDSAVVAALAYEAVGDRALAVTGVTETLAGSDLAHAKRVTAEIGIAHDIVTYSELENAEFVANPPHRCYVCQGLRMGAMRDLAARRDYAVVCDGTNASDPGPDRPGLRAVSEKGIYSPLLVHGVDKSETREIALQLGLSVWDRPSNACLSSRVPHGQVVTLSKLRRVEAAEELLLGEGFRVVRVRHEEAGARVEVGADEVVRLLEQWPRLRPRIEALGFSDAVVDERGYRSGGADRPATASTAATAASSTSRR